MGAVHGLIELFGGLGAKGVADNSIVAKGIAIALNTSFYPDDDEARAVIAAISAETGLPADDPVRFGPAALWSQVRAAVEALPWVWP